MKVFVDTSIFIALSIDKDPDHESSLSVFNRYRKIARFFTSDYVLDEYFTRMAYDFGGKIACREVEKIDKMVERGELILIHIDEFYFKEAKIIFKKFAEHKISFTDASSYAIYQKLNMDEIFTLDADFKRLRAKTSF